MHYFTHAEPFNPDFIVPYCHPKIEKRIPNFPYHKRTILSLLKH